MAKPSPVNFGRLDLAEPCDTPPVLFHAMRCPCACGRSLDSPVYTFFPSAVFVHGTCPECGPRTAIFAPHMKDVGVNLPERVTNTIKLLMTDLARLYGVSAEDVVAEVLEFCVREETKTPPTAKVDAA